MPGRTRIFPLAIFVVGAPLVAPLPATAQTGQSIVGVVSDAASGEPLPTALVSLMDAGERPLRQVVAGPDGRFELPVHAAGAWRIEVSRLGYRLHVEEAVEVGAGERVTLDVRMGAAPIHLEALAVEVAAGSRCRRIAPDHASLVVRLWEEARASLRIVAWASAEDGYAFQQVTWEREADLLGERVVERRGQGRFTGAPFSSAPIDSLSERGWVQAEQGSQAVVWYGPDAEALLSSRFREEHCFGLRPHPERDAWVGVAFEPVRRDGPPGIEGVVWMDRESAELRRLDFIYTAHLYVSLPIPEPLLELFGGKVEFRTLPDGVVVVDAWSIRMPAYLRTVRGGVRAPEVTAEPAAHFRRVRNRLPRNWVEMVHEEVGFGFREQGGELLRIVTPSGVVLPARGVAAVEGIVRDSTAGGFPLAGAEIEILGTGLTRRTGADGRFRAEVPEGGEFDIRVRHPRLDSLGVGDFTRRVALFPGESRAIELAVPSLRTLRAAGGPETRSAATAPHDAPPVVPGRDVAAWIHQPDRSSHEIWLRNDSDGVYWVRAVVLRDCMNVDDACGVRELDVVACPGEAHRILVVRPRDLTSALFFNWDWEAERYAGARDRIGLDCEG